MKRKSLYEPPYAETLVVNAENILSSSLLTPDEEEGGGVIVTPPDEF